MHACVPQAHTVCAREQSAPFCTLTDRTLLHMRKGNSLILMRSGTGRDASTYLSRSACQIADM